jgi:hypothetical protein
MKHMKHMKDKSRKKYNRKNMKRKTYRRKQKGGNSLPIPRGAVASMSLDPKDEYGVPVLIQKEDEDKILDKD